ncbi:hypothetical protein C2869_06165 [Saccharobesus litoralis]|uniref:Uncharacterized protein n=1 Tax=Saccharobesus litoralis TaxID=2172099 RepID=A0A2S0VPA8_9ALTE|nr:hypothetical protein [Saccharobesus litoralis]AWB66048.1 hypothetical protein C2869_06165 [Saccharobesus litoralis]
MTIFNGCWKPAKNQYLPFEEELTDWKQAKEEELRDEFNVSEDEELPEELMNEIKGDPDFIVVENDNLSMRINGVDFSCIAHPHEAGIEFSYELEGEIAYVQFGYGELYQDENDQIVCRLVFHCPDTEEYLIQITATDNH